MIGKNLKDINESDLESLTENRRPEGKTIEYKADLKLGNDREKKEFLADVSAFANANGGDLIFGITDKNGFPSEIKGLNITNVDKEISRIDAIIRDGIDPRLPSINIQPVNLSIGNVVLIIRIGKSWINPHRVTFKGHDKFYTRGSNVKYPMDVSELRVAFNLSDTITEKIRKFRDNRISNIISNIAM